MTSNLDPTTAALAGAVTAVMMVFIAAYYILQIVACWKIFTKAGFAGWKSLIPIYNQYILYRISSMSGWWILLPIISSIFVMCSGSYSNAGSTPTEFIVANIPMAIIGLIGFMASGIVQIVQVVKLAEAFKKGFGFKVAAVFFTPITDLILAFGKAKYNKKALHA